jgi:nicotinamidase-related amidase
MRRGLQPRDGGHGRVAVLALDLISDFDFPDGPAVRRALASRARALRQNLGAWRSDSAALIARCVERHRPGARLVASLLPAADDSIILKPRHSAFFGTPLAALLDDQDIDTLIITGVSAESCVWMTACDAHTRGFKLVIPADTLAGASPKALRMSLTSLRDVLGARVPRQATSLRLARGKLAA